MEFLRLACLAAAVLALAGAAASLLGAVSDAFDVAAHLTPLWVGLAVMALLLGLACGAGPIAQGAAALALLTGGALMGGEIYAALAVKRSLALHGDRTFTLVQFNLWAHNADPAASASWILRQNADVLALEETADRGAQVIADLARAYPHRIAGQPGDDTLLLAKEPPIASGPIGPDGSPSGVWARFRDRRGAYTIVVVHLTWPIPAGPQGRQMDALAARMRVLGGADAILAGDFNSTPWSFALRRQDARLRELGLGRITRALFSWPTTRFRRFGPPSPLPVLPIDQVYAGARWRALSVKRGPALGSDHFPIVVTLKRAP